MHVTTDTGAPRLLGLALWATVVVVGLGIAGNAVRVGHQGWVLEGDNAAIAISAYDTAHGHPRLVGVHSSATQYAGIGHLYHPGPMAYWVAAAPAGLFGWSPDGFLFTAVLVNVVSVAGVAVFVRRRAGPRVAIGALVASSVLVWAVGSTVPHDPWNAYLAVFPWLLTIVLLWSALDRDRAALVPLAFVASFIVQEHFGYLPLVGPLLVVVLLALVRARRQERRDDPDAWAASRRGWVRSVAGAALVAVACWAPVLVEQLTGDPGNIGQLGRFVAGGSPRGRQDLGFALDRLARFLGAHPMWLDRHLDLRDMTRPPSALDRVVAAAVVGAAVALLVACWRRGRTSAARLLGLLLTVLGLQLVATAGLPNEISVLAPYNYQPWWPLCALVWFALAWAALALVPAPVAGWVRAPAVAVVAVLAVVGLAVAVVAETTIADDRSTAAFPAIRGLDARLRTELPGDGPYLVVASGAMAQLSLLNPVVLDLTRHGIDVRISSGHEASLGTFRTPRADHLEAILVIVSGSQASTAPPGGRELLRIDPPPGATAGPPGDVASEAAMPVFVYLVPPQRLDDYRTTASSPAPAP